MATESKTHQVSLPHSLSNFDAEIYKPLLMHLEYLSADVRDLGDHRIEYQGEQVHAEYDASAHAVNLTASCAHQDGNAECKSVNLEGREWENFVTLVGAAVTQLAKKLAHTN